MKPQKWQVWVIVCWLVVGISALRGQGETAKVEFSTLRQGPRPGLKRPEPSIGAPAPDWRLKTAAGKTVALAALRGNVVVLDFWAHWCGPCRKLEPLFDQLGREYQNQPVKFFTLSIWPGEDFNPQAYLREHKLVSTFLLGDDQVADNYGIWGVPTYCVIDGAGKVAYFHTLLVVDPEALGKQLREAIAQALPKAREAQTFHH